MEAIRKFLTIDVGALAPMQRRQVQAINILNMVTVGLAVFMVLVFVMSDFSPMLLNIIMVNVWLSVIVIAAVRYLLRLERFDLAATIYVAAYAFAMIVMSLRYGPQEPTATMSIVLPVVLTALLFGRRSVILVTGLAIAFVIALAGVRHYVWQLPGNIMADAVSESVVILLIGMAAVFWVTEVFRSYEIIRQDSEHLNAALRLGQQITVMDTEQTLLQDFGAKVQATFNLQQIQIFLREPDNPSILHLRSGVGLAAQRALGRTLSIAEENALTMALHSGEPVVARVSDLAYMQSELLPGSNAQLVLPLHSQNNIRGVIDFQSTDEWYFDERRLAVFQALVFQFSNILTTLNLTNHVKTMQAEYDEIFLRVANYRAETARLRRQMAGVVWDRFFQEQSVDVLGFDLPTGAMEPVANNTISHTMEATLKAGAVDVRKTENGYLMALPIVLRGQVLGVLEFRIVRESDLPHHVIDLATTITERLSLALDNARLVQETQAFAYREQQISGVATELQGAATMEDLLALAAEQLNNVLGGSRTHIRLQLADRKFDTQELPDQTSAGTGNAAANGGGAA